MRNTSTSGTVMSDTRDGISTATTTRTEIMEQHERGDGREGMVERGDLSAEVLRSTLMSRVAKARVGHTVYTPVLI